MSWKPQHIAVLVCILAFLLSGLPAYSGELLNVLEGNGLAIHYEPPLRKAAQEVIGIYPGVEDELWGLFGWRPEPKPLILVTEGEGPAFGVDWERTPISAFALPSRDLVVLHWGRAGRDPLRLHDVLKHETCHILLHQRIRTTLPRWLDEGVCQWASDGISELLVDPGSSRLIEAVSARTVIPFKQLETAFPSGDDELLLAYEESKSFVVYLVNRFGKSGVIQVLDLASEGHKVRDGLMSVTGQTLEGLDRNWQSSLKGGASWFMRISHYLYEILFAVMALLAAWGFIRQVLKKRAYRDDAPEDGSI
jgi:hypothetical protein